MDESLKLEVNDIEPTRWNSWIKRASCVSDAHRTVLGTITAVNFDLSGGDSGSIGRGAVPWSHHVFAPGY